MVSVVRTPKITGFRESSETLRSPCDAALAMCW